MSLNLLLSNIRRHWLNIKLQNLSIDGELHCDKFCTCNGDNISFTSSASNNSSHITEIHYDSDLPYEILSDTYTSDNNIWNGIWKHPIHLNFKITKNHNVVTIDSMDHCLGTVKSNKSISSSTPIPDEFRTIGCLIFKIQGTYADKHIDLLVNIDMKTGLIHINPLDINISRNAYGGFYRFSHTWII